jgi:integrase
MRKSKYQQGGVKKQRGRFVGMWYAPDGGRKSKVLGLVKDMTKSEARAAVNRIVAEVKAKQDHNRVWKFGEFVIEVYFPFYSRKWKRSTRENNVNRVSVHLVTSFGDRELSSVKRDELQDLLDAKATGGLSFSVVDHLRWDLKQVFDLAVADGQVQRNPAFRLFTPREATKPERRVMSMKEVQTYFCVLELRERLIAKLAILAGMRPGEIFALKWGRLTATYADIRQRVYRGTIDTPKTDQSVRKAALSEGLLREIEVWREFSVETRDDAWVFPSERLTPLSKDNCWRRSMQPKLAKVGLGWANFLVMRRTHATLMKALGVDGKLVADQLGHSLDVNQNIYTQSPVENRLVAVNQLEKSLLVM